MPAQKWPSPLDGSNMDPYNNSVPGKQPVLVGRLLHGHQASVIGFGQWHFFCALTLLNSRLDFLANRHAFGHTRNRW